MLLCVKNKNPRPKTDRGLILSEKIKQKSFFEVKTHLFRQNNR